MAANVKAEDVKKLRDMTSMPFGDCKTALVEAEGDIKKAVEIMRSKNSKIAAGKAERETAEGRVGVFIHPEHQVAAIVEVRCESAPVAKADAFIKLTNDLAEHVAHAVKGPMKIEDVLQMPMWNNPKQTVLERINEVVGLIRENMKLARFKRLEKGPFGSYVHFDGTVGVLLQAEGEKADAEVLKDVSMHITAKQPMAVRKEHVPAEQIAKETEIAKAQVATDPKNASKPANIVERIVEGKIKTWLAENVLLDQPFVKDDSQTVAQLMKKANLDPKVFVRFKVGELT
jgi:elongation factor Ts